MSAFTIIVFIAVLVALIVVHEFGHFIVAKKLGFRVDEFGIGFPPKLFGKRYGETEYTINALPLGGFVRIFGEDPSDEALHGPDADRAFVNKAKWRQALVLVAGVAFNVIFAWILFAGALSQGMELPSNYSSFGQVQNERTMIIQALENSPAAEAGLKRGDTITALAAGDDTLEATTPDALQAFIDEHRDAELALTYQRAGESETVTLTPAPVSGASTDEPIVGISMQGVGTLQLPPHLAVLEAARFTGDATVAIVGAFGGLIAGAVTGTADLSGVAGPVGIASLVSDATQEGFAPLLSFTAFISLNLAVLNLVPFPALDGGRLVIVAIEAVKGSRVRSDIVNMVNMVGFALLIILMILVTYKDIARLTSGG